MESAHWTKAFHSVPARASTRSARAVKTQSSADLGRATSGAGPSGRRPGPRPREHRGATAAGSGYGPPSSRRAEHARPRMGPIQCSQTRVPTREKLPPGVASPGCPPRVEFHGQIHGRRSKRVRRVSVSVCLKTGLLSAPQGGVRGIGGDTRLCRESSRGRASWHSPRPARELERVVVAVPSD